MSTPDPTKAHSTRRFDRFAEGYVQSEGHAKGSDLDRIEALAEVGPEHWLLDLATGGGHTGLRFAGRAGRVVASDLAGRMLEQARAQAVRLGAAGIDHCRNDAEALPFADASFDRVTCRIAPHHFPGVPRFVDEAARVLRPGGRFVVQDHVLSEDPAVADDAEAFERLRDPSHHRAYPESGWRSMFEASGLRVESVETLTKRHVLRPWAERQGCDEATLAELRRRLEQASPAAAEWMDVEDAEGGDLSFVNHHLIILGVKPR